MKKPNIAALERLHAEATPGPWIVEIGPYSGRNWMVGFGNCGKDGEDYSVTTDGLHASDTNGATAGDDCRLVAAMRNALPALMALARAAWEVDNDLSQSLESHLAPDVYDLWRAALAAMDFEDAGGAP